MAFNLPLHISLSSRVEEAKVFENGFFEKLPQIAKDWWVTEVDSAIWNSLHPSLITPVI
jgi:hypothetical protein